MEKDLIILIHGGPGAAGEMKPVADELRKSFEVLEPHQTEKYVNRQVEELKNQIKESGEPPYVLIGHSWGAWLGWIFTSKYPDLVKKLILISCPPFEKKYADKTMKDRFKKLDKKDKLELAIIGKKISESGGKVRNELFGVFGNIMSKADSYKPIEDNNVIDYDYEIYSNVWPEAEALRESGKLLEIGKQIKCPVIAVHGDKDNHPYNGVKEPLRAILSDFKLIIMRNCGHRPWMEVEAKDEFYRTLNSEIK